MYYPSFLIDENLSPRLVSRLSQVFQRRRSKPLGAVVPLLVLASILGGAVEANPPATKQTTTPITKQSASPAPTASAPTVTKEDNPLEEFAKRLGIPAGVIGLLGVGWFLFTRGKPIQENKKAWRELLQRDGQADEGQNEHKKNSITIPLQHPSVSEFDLIRELEITQEMQEIGVIKEANAIFIQNQKIAAIRILRSSKP